MQPDAPALLWQARRAAGLILEFMNGRTFEDYEQDPIGRSAVERQFHVIGEAVNRLRRVDPGTAQRVLDLPRVAFRKSLTSLRT